jgi:hypothetical protein
MNRKEVREILEDTFDFYKSFAVYISAMILMGVACLILFAIGAFAMVYGGMWAGIAIAAIVLVGATVIVSKGL